MSRNAIRGLADIIRESFGLKNKKYFPVVEFLEHGLTQIDENFVLEIREIQEMTEYGIAYPKDKKIALRQDVYERACDGVPRDRFTIAHEIGHYIMHKPDRIGLARTAEKPKPYQDPEWQANTFAGELLVPGYIIRGMALNQIVTECGVSRAVAEIQFKSLR
jgi:Zn-dependent peptidase ImmA (M78 family)